MRIIQHEPALATSLKAARPWSTFADQLFASQPGHLIRLARLVSASFALLAVYLDPTQPARNVEETYWVLAGYVLYSAALALTPSQGALNGRIHYVTHAVDIVVLSILSFLTGELASPFLAFFSFTLITSAIRWGFTGALATALILDAVLLAVGWPYDDPSRSDLNGLIMRSAYALVAAAMLGHFASYRERSRRRLTHLAAWPIETSAGSEQPWLEGSLRHASEVLGGVRLLVMWREPDEPIGRLVYRDTDGCRFFDLTEKESEAALTSGTERATFHFGDLVKTVGIPVLILCLPRLAQNSPSSRKPTSCSACFLTPRYQGRVFVLDPGLPNEDTLSLTEIVAARIAFELEQFALRRELATAAGWRERSRLARDFHDSVLQDLTAAALQIKIAAQQPPETMRATLKLVGELLHEQQRRIRQFVESARPTPDKGEGLLSEQLRALSRPLSLQWRCALHIDVDPADLLVPNRISLAICQLISEATANAVRHGRAERVDVAIRPAGEQLELTICDNGKGMSDLAAIVEAAPQSIRERVADLGGQLVLENSGAGLRMRIQLPL